MILGDGKWRSNFRPHHYDHRHWGPFFEEAPANTSGPSGFSSGGDYALAAPAGSPLQLDCRVAMLHDKMVNGEFIISVLKIWFSGSLENVK